MKLNLAYYGNPVLRKKAEEVTEITGEIRELVAGMVEILEKKEGLGLAAPQVNHSLRIFITESPILDKDGDGWERGELKIFINPKITICSEETWVHSEGCLSIPKLYGDVERPVAIKVTAMDLEGNQFEEQYEGWPARVILHENDHINGVLFIDRIHGKERKDLDPFLRAVKKKYR